MQVARSLSDFLVNESPGDAGGEEKANILIVDDLPEKLLVFQTVLEELGQNLVPVQSGAAALREILKREFEARQVAGYAPLVDLVVKVSQNARSGKVTEKPALLNELAALEGKVLKQ